jgi:hypothetical protein
LFFFFFFAKGNYNLQKFNIYLKFPHHNHIFLKKITKFFCAIMRGKKKKNKELCIQQEMHEKNSWQLKQAQQETNVLCGGSWAFLSRDFDARIEGAPGVEEGCNRVLMLQEAESRGFSEFPATVVKLGKLGEAKVVTAVLLG